MEKWKKISKKFIINTQSTRRIMQLLTGNEHGLSKTTRSLSTYIILMAWSRTGVSCLFIIYFVCLFVLIYFFVWINIFVLFFSILRVSKCANNNGKRKIKMKKIKCNKNVINYRKKHCKLCFYDYWLPIRVHFREKHFMMRSIQTCTLTSSERRSRNPSDVFHTTQDHRPTR